MILERVGVRRTCRHVALFRLLYVFRARQSHFRADCTSCEIQCSVSGYRGMTAKSSAWPSNCWLLPSLQQATARAGMFYSVIKRNRRARTVPRRSVRRTTWLFAAAIRIERPAYKSMYCRGVASIIARGGKAQGLTNPSRQITVFVLTDHHTVYRRI